MHIKNVDIQWESAPFVREFLYHNLADKSHDRRVAYRKWMARFISFCCQELSCHPQNINFEKFIVVTFKGEKQFSQQITWEFMEKFLDKIPGIRSRYDAETILRKYFRFLLKRGVVKTNPVPPIPHPERKCSPKQGLAYEHLINFIKVLRSWPMPFRAIITLDLAVGLRVGELCALRLEDVDMSVPGHWSIFVRREVLKNKVERKSPLADLPNTFKDYFDWRTQSNVQSEYLFVDHDGNPLTSQEVNAEVAKISELSGCPRKVTSHDMRRGFATILAANCENALQVIDQALRNRNWAVSMGYVRPPNLAQTEQALSRLPVVQLVGSFAAKINKSEKRQ